MSNCCYKGVNGYTPNASDCVRLHPDGREDCTYFMPEPEPEEPVEE